MLIALMTRMIRIAALQPLVREFISGRRRSKLIREMEQLPRRLQRDVGWPPRREQTGKAGRRT